MRSARARFSQPGKFGGDRTRPRWNAGYDPINTLIDLRKAHKEGKVHAGINMDDGRIVKHGKTKSVLSDKRLLNRLGVKVPGCFSR